GLWVAVGVLQGRCGAQVLGDGVLHRVRQVVNADVLDVGDQQVVGRGCGVGEIQWGVLQFEAGAAGQVAQGGSAEPGVTTGFEGLGRQPGVAVGLLVVGVGVGADRFVEVELGGTVVAALVRVVAVVLVLVCVVVLLRSAQRQLAGRGAGGFVVVAQGG